MFYCGKCSKLTKANEPMTKVVVETRLLPNKDGLLTISQIVKEIGICTSCAGIKWPADKVESIGETMSRLNLLNHPMPSKEDFIKRYAFNS